MGDPAPRYGQPAPDQVCVHVNSQDGSPRRTLAFLVEYKPPHKLTWAHLEEALGEPMDIRKELIDRVTIPRPKDEGYFEHESRSLTAKAMTQTYD
jgi:hypothetical protein